MAPDGFRRTADKEEKRAEVADSADNAYLRGVKKRGPIAQLVRASDS